MQLFLLQLKRLRKNPLVQFIETTYKINEHNKLNIYLPIDLKIVIKFLSAKFASLLYSKILLAVRHLNILRISTQNMS